MKYFDKINKNSSYFLTDIHEPNDNSIFLEIKKSTTSDVVQNIMVGKIGLNEKRRIEVDKKSEYFTIQFDGYVSYHVIEEGFINFQDNKDEYKAGEFSVFRVYSKSSYLDFILKETIANDIFPDEMKHYGLYCMNHVVHIISLTEPKIELIDCT